VFDPEVAYKTLLRVGEPASTKVAVPSTPFYEMELVFLPVFLFKLDFANEVIESFIALLHFF